MSPLPDTVGSRFTKAAFDGRPSEGGTGWAAGAEPAAGVTGVSCIKHRC